MKNQFAVAIGISVYLWFSCSAYTQNQHANSSDSKKETAVTGHASGTFEIKMVPQPLTEEETKITLFRMTSEKQFHGDLEGSSRGEMLGVYTAVKDSAGYVAMERVSGKLNGRTGTFVLQHSSTMARGTQHQSITVIPDSGTDQLVGLEGSMIIKITDGKHFYEFDYTLPERNSN